MIETDEFKEALGIKEKLPNEDLEEYQTLGGFFINRFGSIPQEGDKIEYAGYTFEVMDMDKHRVDKVLVTKSRKEERG